MTAASKGIKDAQRLHAQLVPPTRPQSSAGSSSALEEEVSGPVIGWLFGWLVGWSSKYMVGSGYIHSLTQSDVIPNPNPPQLKRGHTLVLGAEMPCRVLQRFNAKLEAELGGMRRRQEEKKAALHALFQASLRGEKEAHEMVQIHNEVCQ